MEIGDALRKYWGFDTLRANQGEVVEAARAGRDALAVLPTGGGKSLCYQLPPLLERGLTVVVSPLISLMKDQVDGLRLLGYPAAALHSNIGIAEAREVEELVRIGDVSLLYMSPERLLTAASMSLLRVADQGRGVKRIAIDEAHCISQWGHDFRPEYRQLSEIRKRFPEACIHAFTATATAQVREDVVRQLGLRDPLVVIGAFDRPNLTYRVVTKTDPVGQVIEAVRAKSGEASIVYCVSRKDSERYAEMLKATGLRASAYHAGLAAEERRRVSEDFARERVDVVVATVAFGMGIDRANVRLVVHQAVPKSIEAYQQETGRAGRDGLPSDCLMLYAPGDIVKWSDLIRKSSAPDQVPFQLAMLDDVRRFASTTTCRHAFLTRHFGQEYAASEEGCGACDICLEGWTEVEGSTRKGHQIIATVLDLDARHADFAFGASHVAAILAGSAAQTVTRHGHDGLRGYGAMRGIPAAKIADWVGQLVDLGYLGRTEGKYPGIRPTQAGADALRGRVEISLRDVAIPDRRLRRGKLPEHDADLYERLRALRRTIAEERGVPAYVVFHDATLLAISAARPSSQAALSKIVGVGERKAKDFGSAVLRVVSDYASERGLALDAGVQATLALSNATSERLRPFFEQGLPLPAIAEQAGLSLPTIVGYLAAWIEEVRPASIESWVDADTYARVEQAIQAVGYGRLRPIRDQLNGSFDYDTIRIVIAHAFG